MQSSIGVADFTYIPNYQHYTNLHLKINCSKLPLVKHFHEFNICAKLAEISV